MTINIITELSSYRENTSELRKFMIDWFDGDVSYNNFIKGIFCGNKNTLEEQADIFTSIDFILENKSLCELPVALLKETICEIDNIWHDVLACYDCIPGVGWATGWAGVGWRCICQAPCGAESRACRDVPRPP